MPTIARIIGSAGTGKTSRLMVLMAKAIESGDYGIENVGFSTFTRAARGEASSRAAEQFGVPVHDLERNGWFRTLHSTCRKMLGVDGELLVGNNADQQWLENAVQEPVCAGKADEETIPVVFAASTEANIALGLWDAARNRLEPYLDAWTRAQQCDESLPSFEWCRGVVERYEQAKRLDHRLDFCDLLARFAGWSCQVDGHLGIQPDGDVPGDLKIHFLDEQQDNSALLHSAQMRLIEHSRWVYATGDPFQALYSWAGAEARHFMQMPASKVEVMPKSYRCPRQILELGEAILRDCTDYFYRHVEPRDDHGDISTAFLRDDLAEQIDPRESWLLLARSNAHAQRLAAILESRGIPWSATRGNNTWNSPKRNAATAALMAMERGTLIDGGEWLKVLDFLPSKHHGTALLARGTKAEWGRMEAREIEERFSFVLPADWTTLGVTPTLGELIRSGEWRKLVEGADR
ncbi:MAG: UvrD-helicase domain-containing protein, partial [Candidatus Dormibacteria bacterium]